MLLLRHLGVPQPETHDYIRLLPAVEALSERGYVVLLKWDGERDPQAGDNDRCTVMLTGGALREDGDFLRTDAQDMWTGLMQVLTALAERLRAGR